MRRIILALMLFVSFSAGAQVKPDLGLFTDRDLYTSGETILFKIYLPEAEKSGLVKVLLTDTKGKIISDINKKIKDQQASGFIYIPDSLKTGSYLLCTTTKANPVITVKELFLCNRFTGLTESPSMLRMKEIRPAISKTTEMVQIEGLNQTYKSREKVQINLRFPAELISLSEDNLSVTVAEVIPEYTFNTAGISARPQKSFVSDNEGIVLEGVAKDLATGKPFQNGCIFLSIPDSIPGLDYFITAGDGNFHFQLLNYYGKIPVVVQGIDPGRKRLLKISVHHTDSLQGDVPKFETLPVPKDFLRIYESATEATTLRKIFNCQELTIDTPKIKRSLDYPFYGVPTEVVYPALFEELPDFTEISRELLPGVKFRANNRIPTLQILNPVTLNFFNDQPLVTLDGVPVQDLNVIKNLGSQDIKRIEISRSERFYGDLRFPGVVAIYSTNPDYRLFKESDELIKFTMDAFQADVSLHSPVNLKLNDPDLRKVLLWNPNLKTEETVRLDFITSDILGNFRLIVRVKNRDGSIEYKEKNFEVK